jgi:tetratricopeptide (TPR) repeat protein
MSYSQIRSLVGVGAAIVLMNACAAVPKTIYTQEEIVSEMEARVSAELKDQIVIPFEIDDDIRQLADDITHNLRSDREKVRAIVQAIIGLTQFSISYDWLSNKTASEVFRQGRGNCLAYSNLFVGMARHVGLDAVYVDVVSIERQTREAEVIVNNGHVTAGINQGANVMVIDFTRTPEREYLGFKVIDDLEAIANYYNNQGFLYGYFTEIEEDQVDFDPMEKEMEMYRLALEVLPTFQRARNNLGVGLRRRGKVQEAIEQYNMAIEVDPTFPDAHANLGAAYYLLGRVDEAVEELKIAARESGQNGYFYHNLGVVQFRLERYDEAIKGFRSALSKEPGMASARYYLGESYLRLGDTGRAIEEYAAALQLDPNHESARSMLDRLTGQGEDQARD